MKKLSYFLIASALLAFAACGSSETDNKDSAKVSAEVEVKDESSETASTGKDAKRFEIKEGMIEYEMNIMITTVKMTTYFKDYGAVQASIMETDMMGVKTVERELQKNGEHYRFKMTEKTGEKIIMDTEETDPMEINFANLSDEAKAKYKIKETGEEKFLDKPCKIFTTEAEEGTSKMWIWKGIPLKMSVAAQGMNFDLLTAKKVSESPTFPADIFEIPAGFTITEVKASDIMPNEK